MIEALGAIGGNFILFSYLFSMVLNPFSHHLFVLGAIEKLFLAKTKEKEFMNWSSYMASKNLINNSDGKF